MRIDECVLRNIDLNSLITFLVVYRERGVSRAAKALHVTQPAVSNALSKLRNRFEDPLFIPHGRSVQPTPKAISIAESLIPAFEQVQYAITADGSQGMEATSNLRWRPSPSSAS